MNGSGELRADFISGAGTRAQGQEAIIPILKATENPKRLTCIGTGFFISSSGIFATAAHVIRDVIDANGVPLAGLVTLQFIPPNNFVLREIIKVTCDLRADVAIGAVRTKYDEFGDPIKNRTLILTTRTPLAGASIHTWAYPNSTHTIEGNVGSVGISPKIYEGHVTQEHREGRDKVMLPGPCYETDLGIDGGASGGPVFDSMGDVFAINSTGIDGTDIAYVSHIQRIGGLPLQLYLTEDGVTHDSMTIHEMIKRGHIVVKR